MFKCDKCGSCCRNLNLSNLYSELDRGDGVCKFLDGNLCLIYDERPLLCRIDESYDAFFSKEMSRDEYYRINKIMCDELKKHKK